MSNKATKWAWQAELPQRLKKVLVALADYHNGKTGQCNPRVSVIAGKLGCSERTVFRALKELQDAGYIAKAKRRRRCRQASNHYNLALDGVVFQVTDPAKVRVTKCQSETCQNVSLYIEQEKEGAGEKSNVLPFRRVMKEGVL